MGNTGLVNSVDFDPQELKIYWTNDNGEVSRAFLNGSAVEKVLQISTRSIDIDRHAIDAIGRNLYWFNSTPNQIGVSKLDGQYSKVLISLPLADFITVMVLDSLNG